MLKDGAVLGDIADQRMLLEELEGVLFGCLREEAAQVLEPEQSMAQSSLTGLIDAPAIKLAAP